MVNKIIRIGSILRMEMTAADIRTVSIMYSTILGRYNVYLYDEEELVDREDYD